MNGLSDSLTIGLVIVLVFGAISFYLYSRIGQVEKRVSLTENILLDLKMATENTLMAMGGGGQHAQAHEEHGDSIVNVGVPVKDEAEHANDEDFYKSVLEQTASEVAASLPVKADSEMVSVPLTTTDDIPFLSGGQTGGSKVDVNYESMTLKELKALVKQRGIAAGNATHKKDYIDLLRKQGSTSASHLEPIPGSFGGPMGSDEGGFPVDLGSAENRNAQQE